MKMLSDITTKSFETVVQHREADCMPDSLAGYDSVELLKKFLPYTKGLVFPVMKRDAAGKILKGQVDETVAPRSYLDLIQGKDKKTGEHTIYTKFLSAQVLNPEIAEKIASGALPESKFRISPEKLKNVSFEGLIEVGVDNIFVKSDTVKIRSSLQTVWITKFVTRESEGSKNVRAKIAASGVTFDGPGEIPDAEEESQEPSGDEDAEVQEVQISTDSEGTFEVKVG